MAPVQNLATSVPAANNPAELDSLPEKTPKRIADELLEDALKNDRVAKFMAANNKASLELAWRVTRNWDLAETAVSETYVELLEGRTSIQHFFRALKMNARNLTELRVVQRSRSESLEALLDREDLAEADLDRGEEPEDKDFSSNRADDQDPMDILIVRQQTAIYGRLVQAALADPRWRYIKRRRWARPLLAECAESGPWPE